VHQRRASLWARARRIHTAVAQKLAARRADRASSGDRPIGHGAKTRTTRNSFKGIASKLHTTPEELQTSYAAAKQANPKPDARAVRRRHKW